jgi:hypothetical protein
MDTRLFTRYAGPRIPKDDTTICAFPKQLAQAARNPRIREVFLTILLGGEAIKIMPYPKALFIRIFSNMEDFPVLATFDHGGTVLVVDYGDPAHYDYSIDWTEQNPQSSFTGT